MLETGNERSVGGDGHRVGTLTQRCQSPRRHDGGDDLRQQRGVDVLLSPCKRKWKQTADTRLGRRLQGSLFVTS